MKENLGVLVTIFVPILFLIGLLLGAEQRVYNINRNEGASAEAGTSQFHVDLMGKDFVIYEKVTFHEKGGEGRFFSKGRFVFKLSEDDVIKSNYEVVHEGMYFLWVFFSIVATFTLFMFLGCLFFHEESK